LAAVGYEIDETLVRTAQELWAGDGLHIRQADFTGVTPPTEDEEQFNLVVTNPPYVRHHHLTQAQKRRLASTVTHQIGFRPNGLMGLYGYFLLLAHAWLQPNGLGVWLIPSEFMDVNYGATLRHYLTEKVELIRLHRFAAEDVQFMDADVTSTVLFLRNRQPAPDQTVLFSTGADLEQPQTTVSVPAARLKDMSKWSAVLKQTARRPDQRLADQEAVIKLGDLFEVKRGIATGANKFFMMPRVEAERLGLPALFLKPILPSPRYLRNQSVIEADPSGNPLVEPDLVLLSCTLSKAQLAQQYPDLYAYILQGEQQHLPQRYLLSRRNPWYRQEERLPAPIVCGYMARKDAAGRSIRFYRNKSQAITANVYLLLYPKPFISHYHPNPDALLDQVFAQLLTLDPHEIDLQGRTYGGGLDKVEPSELMQVALAPSPEIEALSAWLHPLIGTATNNPRQLPLL
jgi:hypothetical protein